MSRVLKLGNNLRELRVHLCQNGDASKGVREFIHQFYVDLKRANSAFPILIRECSGVQPRLWARYGHGRETSVSLSNLSAKDVLKQIENVSKK